MSLPNDQLSSTPVVAPWMYTNDYTIDRFNDYEMGGLALNDPSQGLEYQVWHAWIESNEVWLQSGTHPAAVVYSSPGIISDISITFDQNMRLTMSYVEDGRCYLYWYDSSVPGHVTTDFGHLITPKVSLDDKRPYATQTSDIIFAYINNRKLCYRQQRDRFLIERELSPTSVLELKRIGMNEQLRMQFEIVQ